MSTLSLRARGLAALVVLVLFPFFLLFLVVVIVVAAGWLAQHVGGSVASHVAVLLIPLGLAVFPAIRDMIRARKRPPAAGPELTREEHPALWAELDSLAAAMKQPRPDRVVVQPAVNAFVTTAAGHREVMIGYPLLAGLNRVQLRSVLAHEMGHLAHGHTRTGGLTYRGGAFLRSTASRLDNGLMQLIVLGYYRVYLLISLSVVRDHERQADEWSARLAGGPDAASVFPELARLEAVWELLGRNYLPLAAQINAHPPLVEAIHQLSEGHKADLDSFVAEQIASKPSRWSTHPGSDERIRRLQAAPALGPAPARPEAAWELLGRQRPGPRLDPDLGWAALLAIEAEFLPDDTSPASWEQVVQVAALEGTRNHTGFVIDQLAAQHPDRRASLRELLDVLVSESGGPLVAPLLRGDLNPDQRAAALSSSIVGAADAAVLTTLADQGRARMSLRWDGPAQLEYLARSGESTTWPSDLELNAPLNRAQVARLTARLVEDGVDIDAPLSTDPQPLIADRQSPAGTTQLPAGAPRPGVEQPRPARRLRSIVNGAVVAFQLRPRRPGENRRTMYDVLVMDDGLLFSRVTMRYGMVAMMQAQYAPGPIVRKGMARVQELAERVAGDPQAWADDPAHASFWVPFPDISRAVSHKPRVGFKSRRVTFTRADGSTLSIKWVITTFEMGEVESVLRAALHDRMT